MKILRSLTVTRSKDMMRQDNNKDKSGASGSGSSVKKAGRPLGATRN